MKYASYVASLLVIAATLTATELPLLEKNNTDLLEQKRAALQTAQEERQLSAEISLFGGLTSLAGAGSLWFTHYSQKVANNETMDAMHEVLSFVSYLVIASGIIATLVHSVKATIVHTHSQKLKQEVVALKQTACD